MIRININITYESEYFQRLKPAEFRNGTNRYLTIVSAEPNPYFVYSSYIIAYTNKVHRKYI